MSKFKIMSKFSNFKKMVKRTNVFSLSPREMQQMIEQTGQQASYIAGNQTEAVQALTNGAIDTVKGGVTTHSGSRIGQSVYKGVKDYVRGDSLCTGLCLTAGVCEATAGVLVWTPIPAKPAVIATLKAVSYGCIKYRDLCAGNC